MPKVLGRANNKLRRKGQREKENSDKLQNASYHTGYKESQAAPWELCPSPELEWWQGQSREVHFLEWWVEEEPVEHTGLLGEYQNCSLLKSNKVWTHYKMNFK